MRIPVEKSLADETNIPESRDNFSAVKSRTLLGKYFIIPEMKIQISAVDVLHDEAETFVGAERILQ